MSIHRTAAAVAATLVFAAPLPAQSTRISDSVLALFQANHHGAAAQLAHRTLMSPQAAALPLEERCMIRMGMLWSLWRLGMLSVMSEELHTYDADCANAKLDEGWTKTLPELRDAVSLPPLPRTGFDFSAVDQFWMMVDTLSRDIAPSEAQWRNMMRSTGYRMIDQPALRSEMQTVFMPSHRAQRDSLIARDNDESAVLRHLLAAGAMRADLTNLRDSLARHASVTAAVHAAAVYLPKGATEGQPSPLVAFALFRDDGFAQDNGVIVDLLFVHDNGLIPLLSHEFHHAYLGPLATFPRPPRTSPEGTIVSVFYNMRNEGIADLIDKPYPLQAVGPSLQNYAARYNAAYARTSGVLHVVDSLLTLAARDSAAMRTAATRIANAFVYNGHPNGAYMARTILETFGADSLIPGVYTPFAFLRTFAAAEKKRGNPPPFSPDTWRLLDALEKTFAVR
jgi:hypothetical protein